MRLQRLGCYAIQHQPSFCLAPIQNLSYIEAATFLSIKEVIPEVHFELICKQAREFSERPSFVG